MLYLLTFGPLVLTIAAWIRIVIAREFDRVKASGLLALGVTTANALISSGIVLYHAIHPTPANVPPWQDSQVLDLALLFLSAPVGMGLGVFAGIRGSAEWLVAVVAIASLPLLAVGILAGMAV